MVRPKPFIANLKPCVHGGLDYAELEGMGTSPDSVLDFSVCVNPCGPPPGVADALRGAAVERYPDSLSTELRRELSRRLSLPLANVIVASGSSELIRMAALAYFGAGDDVMAPAPTYGDYEVACGLVGARFIAAPRATGKNIRVSPAGLVRYAANLAPRGIFLCNPNNPTGQYFTKAQVEAVLRAARKSLVVLDEAYVAFVGRAWDSSALVREYDNLLIARSMTKDYAVAGLRLGYGIAGRAIMSVLNRVQPPWSVNVIAQRAGGAALRSDAGGYLDRCRAEVSEGKAYLVRELTGFGFTVAPSAANFFLMRVGDARKFRGTLLKGGILVRDCTSFGLPDYVRIGVRTLPECRKLVTAIKNSGLVPA